MGAIALINIFMVLGPYNKYDTKDKNIITKSLQSEWLTAEVLLNFFWYFKIVTLPTIFNRFTPAADATRYILLRYT